MFDHVPALQLTPDTRITVVVFNNKNRVLLKGKSGIKEEDWGVPSRDYSNVRKFSREVRNLQMLLHGISGAYYARRIVTKKKEGSYLLGIKYHRK